MNEYNDYEDLGDIEFSNEESEKYEKMIELAEKQIEDVRVSFRWRSKQLDLIKEAASFAGVPYQTYMKLVLFRQSLEDVIKAKKQLI